MAMLIFRRFIIVLWAVALIVSIISMFIVLVTSDSDLTDIGLVAAVCLIILSIPLALSYILFDILNPIKLVKYK